MGYGLAADALAVLHAAFVAFVVLGGLLALRFRWVAAAHLPAVLWGVLIEAGGLPCPLTPLEWWLRDAAGEAGHGGGFIDTHLMGFLYPAGLTRAMQWGLAALLLAGNGVIYAIWLKRGRGTRA